MPRSVDYHEHLIKSLRSPREAQAYLNAALEEGDINLFLKALRNVAEARGVQRGGRVFRALSKGEKPSIENNREYRRIVIPSRVPFGGGTDGCGVRSNRPHQRWGTRGWTMGGSGIA